jgi:AraC-like DNA-binding protein
MTNRVEPRLRPGGPASGVDARTQLLGLPIGLVETVSRVARTGRQGADDYSPAFQVVFPYRGMHVWHVGGDEVIADANQVLFVTGGESFRISDPLSDGFDELIITPELDVLSDMANAAESRLPAHPLFRRRSRRADPRLQSLRARFLCWATRAEDVEDLAAEELVLALLRAALDLDDEGPRLEPSGSTSRLIRRTKAFLEAEFANPIRLPDVGRAVGASPAYLTSVFRRVEGVSLHQYLTQLRLARALVDLPHSNDLTVLALNIGFSSHSHFTAAFRRAFGCTPSSFRQTTRRGLRPLLTHTRSFHQDALPVRPAV